MKNYNKEEILIRICLCDDDNIVAKGLERLIDKELEKRQLNANIIIVNSARELLDIVNNINVVFLDIEMPEVNGLEVAKLIKRKNPKCIIIISTNIKDKMREGIHIGVSDYITKPYTPKDINIAFNIIENHMIGEKTIKLYYARESYDIKQKDIERIIAYNGYILCRMGKQEFRKVTSIKKILEELDAKLFFRVDRQVVINFSIIDDYRNGYIYVGNEKIKVARDRKKEFERAYIEYDLNYRF